LRQQKLQIEEKLLNLTKLSEKWIYTQLVVDKGNMDG
jgi:hypothetical protein